MRNLKYIKQNVNSNLQAKDFIAFVSIIANKWSFIWNYTRIPKQSKHIRA